jgi:hypothetical protein
VSLGRSYTNLCHVWNGLVLALGLALGVSTGTAAVPEKQTLWVFPTSFAANPVTDSSARQTLVNHAANTGIAELYLSVYSSMPNAAGRFMYDEAAIADLIERAHSQGMQVSAAYGAPDWPTFGCNPNGFPLQRMAEVAAYNSVHPAAKFDGVILDIEPPEPQSASDFRALLSQYACIRTALPGDVRLSVAIRFFWDAIIEYPPGSQVLKPVYEHIIDMNLNNVVVMGYRDFSGPADCTNDGIVCLDQDEVAYAFAVGKPQLILAGLETSDPAMTGITNRETFFEEGESAMNTEARAVLAHFGYGNGLGGFAIHNYEESYLVGSMSWPATDPVFPTNTIAVTSIKSLQGGTVRLAGVGVPNHSHTIETALDPQAASFTPFVNVTADESGALNFDDTSAANLTHRFYRITFP